MNTAQQLKVEKQRHSLAHILAFAVKRLFPDVKIGIGPVTDVGFYYEFDTEHKFTHEDLANIENEMHKIIEENIVFTNIVIPREQALQTLLQLGETYKTELLNKIPDAEVSFYKTGDEFIDLCRGPHVKSTGELENFKLTKITKNYWLNDTSRPLLQRIHGVAFETKKKLNDYLENLQKLSEINSILIAEKLDYLKLVTDRKSSAPIWLTDGIVLQQNIIRFLEEQIIESNFHLVKQPWITDKSSLLDEKFDKYLTFKQKTEKLKDSVLFYRSNISSFLLEHIRMSRDANSADIEMNYGSIAKTFRGDLQDVNEKMPEHLEDFMEKTDVKAVSLIGEERVKEVIINHIRLIGNSLKAFGFSQFKTILETPNYQNLENYLYDEKSWEKSISLIKETILEIKIPSRVREGRAAFFGPKITIEVKDKYSRNWEISSIIIDSILPKELGIKNPDHTKQVYFIHSNIVENIEKLIDLMLEHGEGSLPLWLEPVQIEIIALENKYKHKAIKILRDLKKSSIRAVLDDSDTNPNTRIASAINKHTPYILIIGEKEANTDSISVKANGQDLGLMRVSEFIQKIQQEIDTELDI